MPEYFDKSTNRGRNPEVVYFTIGFLGLIGSVILGPFMAIIGLFRRKIPIHDDSISSEPELEFIYCPHCNAVNPYRLGRYQTMRCSKCGGDVILPKSIVSTPVEPEPIPEPTVIAEQEIQPQPVHPNNAEIYQSDLETIMSDDDDIETKMRTIYTLCQEGMISAEEYEAKRKELLDRIRITSSC